MKRTIPLFLATFLLCSLLAVPASAAEAAESGRDSAYYPISVEEYVGGDFDEPRIQKVYQLSLDDDPSLIPTGDFERNGRLYYLLDMTRKDEVPVSMTACWKCAPPSAFPARISAGPPPRTSWHV